MSGTIDINTDREREREHRIRYRYQAERHQMASCEQHGGNRVD
jgi:hypothetical protein